MSAPGEAAKGGGGPTAIILAGGLGTRLRESVSDRPKVLAEVSMGLGAPMSGLEVTNMPAEERFAGRGI